MTSETITIAGQRFNPVGPESKLRHRPVGKLRIFTHSLLKRDPLTDTIILKVRAGKFSKLSVIEDKTRTDRTAGFVSHEVDAEENLHLDVNGRNTVLIGRLARFLDQSTGKGIQFIEGLENIQRLVMRAVEKYREDFLNMEREGVHQSYLEFFSGTIKNIKLRFLGINDEQAWGGSWELMDIPLHNKTDELTHAICFGDDFASIPVIASRVSFAEEDKEQGVYLWSESFNPDRCSIVNIGTDPDPHFLYGLVKTTPGMTTYQGIINFSSPLEKR